MNAKRRISGGQTCREKKFARVLETKHRPVGGQGRARYLAKHSHFSEVQVLAHLERGADNESSKEKHVRHVLQGRGHDGERALLLKWRDRALAALGSRLGLCFQHGAVGNVAHKHDLLGSHDHLKHGEFKRPVLVVERHAINVAPGEVGHRENPRKGGRNRGRQETGGGLSAAKAKTGKNESTHV